MCFLFSGLLDDQEKFCIPQEAQHAILLRISFWRNECCQGNIEMWKTSAETTEIRFVSTRNWNWNLFNGRSAQKSFYVLQCFRDAIKAAQAYKNNSTDFMDEIMKELDVRIFDIFVL